MNISDILEYFPRNMIPPDISLYEELLEFNFLRRLKFCKQVPFTFPPAEEYNRLYHSFHFSFLTNLLTKRLKLDNKKRNLGKITSIVHDAGTPSGGPVTEKCLGIPDEDLFLSAIKANHELDNFNDYLSKFDLDVYKIWDYVQGKKSNEILGQLINWRLGPNSDELLDLDEVSYTIVDSEKLMKKSDIPNPYKEIDHELIDEYGGIVFPYDSIPSLIKILNRRWQLTDEFYFNKKRLPIVSFSIYITKKMLDEKLISHDWLLTHTDEDLYNLAKRKMEDYHPEIIEMQEKHKIKPGLINQFFVDPFGISPLMQSKEIYARKKDSILEKMREEKIFHLLFSTKAPKYSAGKTPVLDEKGGLCPLEDIYEQTRHRDVYLRCCLYFLKKDANQVEKLKILNNDNTSNYVQTKIVPKI